MKHTFYHTKRKLLVVEKDLDIEFFDSLLEEEKIENTKEIDSNSRLEVEIDVREVEMLDEDEIDKYLDDVVNIEKQVECLECEKWLEEIRKKVEELEKLEIIGNNPIRKDNKEVYKL